VIGIFKTKTPVNILLLLVFGVLIKLPLFTRPQAVIAKPEDGILYKGILQFLQVSPFMFSVLAFLLIAIQAITLTRFINTQRMINRPTYLPGMAYMIITSLLPEWSQFSAPLIVNTISVFILAALFKTYSQPNAKGSIFNIGLALGISSFIFFPSITFIIWILLALAVMRPFRLNEWVLCILGITAPYYFYAIYLFVVDKWSWHNMVSYISVSLPSVKQSAWLAGSTFLLVAPFLLGGYYVQDTLRKMLIQVRKGWSLLLLYLLGAIFIPFVNNSTGFENWVIAAIPFAAFHGSAYYYAAPKILSQVIFWLSIAFIFCYQYVGPGWY
jgi:hypothetical protein